MLRYARRAPSIAAFALAELVAVLAVVGTLSLILIAAWSRHCEMARRVTCRDNLRQLGVAAHIYANAHGGWLFPHTRNYGDWFTSCLSSNVYAELVALVGERVVDCPNLYPYTIPGLVDAVGGRSQASWGIYIGYNYLGGIQSSNMNWTTGWESPVRIQDDESLPLFADANNMGYNEGYWVTAPHGRTGPVRVLGNRFIRLTAEVSPQGVGAEGGNVGLLGGGVEWRPVARMQQNYWIFQHDMGNRGTW
ncbi:MAG TPA: DUF1559 domain-containing protein [Candidatus Limnocylindria bacterium]|jgi:hypothetical protein|nr:DUF1559 domain-containing protein [Candidatus Limnocylindria bacterium]